jgi:hypothetical protein
MGSWPPCGKIALKNPVGLTGSRAGKCDHFDKVATPLISEMAGKFFGHRQKQFARSSSRRLCG